MITQRVQAAHRRDGGPWAQHRIRQGLQLQTCVLVLSRESKTQQGYINVSLIPLGYIFVPIKPALSAQRWKGFNASAHASSGFPRIYTDQTSRLNPNGSSDLRIHRHSWIRWDSVRMAVDPQFRPDATGRPVLLRTPRRLLPPGRPRSSLRVAGTIRAFSASHTADHLQTVISTGHSGIALLIEADYACQACVGHAVGTAGRVGKQSTA